MADDNCDGCGKDYSFNPAADHLNLYPEFPRFNHVHAHCPHCGTTTTIFCDIDSLLRVAETIKPTLYGTVHTEVARSRATVDAQAAEEPEPLWLSPRTEKYIAYFRNQLERGVME